MFCAPDLQIPHVELQFDEVVGKGGFAVVHKGSWRERVVALKTVKLPPDLGVHELASQREILALR